jgi:hypothetical protein
MSKSQNPQPRMVSTSAVTVAAAFRKAVTQ